MSPQDGEPRVRAVDFDQNRNEQRIIASPSSGSSSRRMSINEEDGLLADVVDGIVDEDRAMMSREIARYVSFTSSIISSLCAGSITGFSLYGPQFLSELHYNQYEINTISVGAELATYLPVPLFGYLVDRYSPRPVALFSAFAFAFGYLLAAFTYRSGPREESGWPLGVMVLAFCAIGMGTASMYLAAVTAVAKNFAESKYKGIALALPIASFGLSGMWQSQVGSHFLSEINADGSRGEVDVFRYFIFLGFTLFGAGVVGSVAQKVVNEEELIDEAVEELQRSGLLEDSPFFLRDPPHSAGVRHTGYGTITPEDTEDERETDLLLSPSKFRDHNEEEQKKVWLLNGETRRFISDHTMWFLALGFFLITGPVEMFINNFGTMLATLYPPPASIPAHATAQQVSILAIASTAARIVAGLVSDLISPTTAQASPQYRALTPGASMHEDPFDRESLNPSSRFSISRLTLLVCTAGVLVAGCLLLLSPVMISHPSTFSIVTALFGTVNGASFALVPLLISAVWGVQNFGTNWGIVAMMPALGATLWSALYSVGYQAHTGSDGLCYGQECFAGVAGGVVVAGVAAMASWIWIGWGRDGWWKRGVVV